jgi:hypothetical protein
MAKRRRTTYDEKMRLDMPFSEALERYAGTNPAEMRANITRSKKKKPLGGRKRKPPSDVVQNVVSLRNARKRKHG